ncbi:MAG: aminotransferase class V-fold PLP-dependent enzyme [Planctomycetota bacterium]|nr:aminotransferase class V-fold PLP-dependent enzyme [Planctomycetota bacterium]
MNDRFSHLWPPQNEDVFAALKSVYRKGDWGRYHGAETQKLEEKLAEYFSCSHVHLVCSGTIGVELALRGLGVESGDEVILAAYDFPGNFRSIEAIGARPVLADIACGSWSLCARSFEAALSPSTKAVIVSSLHGGLADIQSISETARQRGVLVVEDICQVPGAMVNGRRVGTYGDVAVLSFGGSKLLSAGRGGAILTSDESIWQRINVFKDRGNDAFALSQLQAAVLNPQLECLDEYNLVRRKNADKLIERTASIDGVLGLSHAKDDVATFYKVAWLVSSGQQRAELLTVARELGLPLFEGFRGFAKRSERRCAKPVALDNSQLAAEGTVLLHHPPLLAEDSVIDELGEQLAKLLEQMG